MNVTDEKFSIKIVNIYYLFMVRIIEKKILPRDFTGRSRKVWNVDFQGWPLYTWL